MENKSNILTPQELALYKHRTTGRVKFNEVDAFHVVHNVQYFYWLEWARILYMETAGVAISPERVRKDFVHFIVHSEIDYFNPAVFGMNYEVLTRVSFIKNSSLGFSNLILSEDGNLLIKAQGIVAHVDPRTRKSVRVPEDIRLNILNIEGEDVKFLD